MLIVLRYKCMSIIKPLRFFISMGVPVQQQLKVCTLGMRLCPKMITKGTSVHYTTCIGFTTAYLRAIVKGLISNSECDQK